MPDLVALRARAEALVGRKRAIREALGELAAIRFRVTPGMGASLRDVDDEGELEEDEAAILREAVPGRELSLTSAAALHCLAGSPAWTDRHSWWTGRHVAHAFRSMERRAAESLEFEPGETPALDGITPFELGAMVDAYVREIERMTFEIRDVGTYLAQATRERAAMPRAVRERCLGLFGKPDFETAFAYVERDFAANATEFVRVPRPDPSDPRGPYDSVRVDHHPRVLEARALAPHLGDAAGRRIEALLDAIAAAAAPLPGEPPLETGFSSHRSNRIAVSFHEAETAVVPPGPVPVPGL